MGCKHSKPESALGMQDKSSNSDKQNMAADTLESGIEDGPDNENHLFSPVQAPEATPRDLRKIREELFAKHSLVAIASSNTAETLGTMPSDEVMFATVSAAKDSVRFLENCETTLSTHTSLNEMYHYPAALYGDLKSRSNNKFVPTFSSMATTHHHVQALADRVPSLQTTHDETEESSSVVSGISQLDLQNVPPEGYPESDHLIDTMALSLEPLSANSERSNCMQRKKQPQTLGALVDSMTFPDEDEEEEDDEDDDDDEEDDDDDDFASCDGGETATMQPSSCQLANDTLASLPNKNTSRGYSTGTELVFLESRTVTRTATGTGPERNSMSRTGTGTGTERNSMSLPELEKTMSAEILSLMKTQALLKRSSHDKASVLLSFSKASTKNSAKTAEPEPKAKEEVEEKAKDPEAASTATAAAKPPLPPPPPPAPVTTTLVACGDDGTARLLKYHRINSIVPRPNDAVSVCSEFGGWM